MAKEPSEAELQEEAIRYEVPWSSYKQMSPKLRGTAKRRWRNKIRKEAEALGLDPNEWESLPQEERDRRRENKKLVRQMQADVDAPPAAEPAPDAPEAPAPEEPPEPEAPVYTADADVPPTEQDPLRRDGMTIGPIEELPPDFLGKEREKNPRTLTDLYARWPVGDGQYYLRVERKQPKFYQNIACAGYLGDVHHRISESEFHQRFGGREYEVTLYGPSPTGRTDPETGNVRIKALTNPIEVKVPVSPPILMPMEKTQENNMNPMNPGFPWGAPQPGTPTTPADATIHKTNTDMMAKLLNLKFEEDKDERRRVEESARAQARDSTETQKSALEVMKASMDRTIEQIRSNAEASAAVWRAQAEEARAAADKARQEIDKVRAELQSVTGRSDGNALELMREWAKGQQGRDTELQKDHSRQLDSLRQSHQSEIDVLRRSNEEFRLTVEERHRGELNRANERVKEQDDFWRNTLQEARTKAEEAEKRLKDELERVRREAKEEMADRLRTAREQFEDRFKDQEKAHQREINALRESMETRAHSQMTAKDFELSLTKQRLDEVRDEIADARARAEENNDPIAVMKKAQETAEAFGFKKEDNTPKTTFDRFIDAAAPGVGQFLAGADKWLTPLLQRAPQGAPRPNGQTPPQLQAPPGQAPANIHRRAVQWAAEHVPPPTPTNVPSTPLGFAADGASAQGTPPAAAAPAAPPPPAAPAPPAPAPPAAPPPPPAQQPIENQLSQAFSNESVIAFLQQLEVAINRGMHGKEFAQRFWGLYPEQAKQMVTVYQAKNITDFVRALPGGDQSAILRRDGTKFLGELFEEIGKKARSQEQKEAPGPEPAA